ncbi:hypothetical protein Bca52824_086438 [Brassica carinata]|uniref:Uncharacterized protein n=1 Tax=Brassica carinata TaxID=52824 RepID=A0A8X7TLV7_BRACI|nr:hypothetical protein Bca52824_086438 [Brassica carinata]
MMQYTQCNDPTESAARRERMRRAEEKGEMEETAALMIQAKMTAPTDTVTSPEQQPSGERVPATLRLGPIAPPTQEPAPKITVHYSLFLENMEEDDSLSFGDNMMTCSFESMLASFIFIHCYRY